MRLRKKREDEWTFKLEDHTEAAYWRWQGWVYLNGVEYCPVLAHTEKEAFTEAQRVKQVYLTNKSATANNRTYTL